MITCLSPGYFCATRLATYVWCIRVISLRLADEIKKRSLEQNAFVANNVPRRKRNYDYKFGIFFNIDVGFYEIGLSGIIFAELDYIQFQANHSVGTGLIHAENEKSRRREANLGIFQLFLRK